MNKQYYVAMPDGTPVGPLNREMILQMLRAKQLCPVQLVFTEGMTEWQPINVVFSDVPGLGVFNSREWGPIVAWTICMSSKYATFSGRASRSEYWWFSLANVLVFLLIGVVFFLIYALTEEENVLSAMVVMLCIYWLAALVPGWAVTSRRLHDIGKSGWWQLLAYIPIVSYVGSFIMLLFAVTCSDGPNSYGMGPERPTK